MLLKKSIVSLPGPVGGTPTGSDRDGRGPAFNGMVPEKAPSFANAY
jgi:hypothetical protein